MIVLIHSNTLILLQIIVDEDSTDGYVGCWQDGGPRDLDVALFVHLDVRITACMDICYKISYQYAGIQVNLKYFF